VYMHKNIGATVIGRDKAISAICVEEFDPPTWHAQLIQSSAKRVMPERVMPQKAACRRPNSDVLARESSRCGIMSHRSVKQLAYLSRLPSLKSGSSTWRQEEDMAPKPGMLALSSGWFLRWR
jgi:hypothetical protein